MIQQCDKKLVLPDGTEYPGYGFGAEGEALVEIIFNTSMTGYQEILSDPAYANQAVVLTYPIIGNCGVCDTDDGTFHPALSGLIVREYSEEPSNFRATKTLGDAMKEYGVVGLSGVQTRDLAKHIRDHGTCKGLITSIHTTPEEAKNRLNAPLPAAPVRQVSTKTVYRSPAADSRFHLAVIDCGMKPNTLELLHSRGCDVTVMPWDTSAEAVLELAPDGLVLTGGPGDPRDVAPAIELVRGLRGKMPIFGLSLGHEILALACGAEVQKMKAGHHGGNHPVRDLKSGKIEITSQNHSYVVDPASLEGTGLEVTQLNILDGTVEAMADRTCRILGVQYDPETDCALFDEFISMMEDK